MQRRTLFSVVAVAACGAALWAASNPKPVNWHDLPEPFHTPSASNRPQVVDRPEGAQLSLPDGFTADVFAEGDFNRPRYMLLGQNDEILLSDSGDRNERNGAVYALSLDGKIEKKVLEGLDRPYGLQLHEDWLYVAETTSVKRYKYDGESRTAQTPGEQLVDMSEFGDGHWTRTLLFTPDHSKFYLTIGSASNIDLNEDPMRAALHRYNPDGSGHETVATGLRNIIGLRFYPGTTDLWAAVQERDGLGDNLVPDYLVKIQEGGFYGWPIAYTGPHEEPRHKGVNPEKVQQSLYPDVLLGAHVAVLGMNFYEGEMFPEKYRGGLFLAFHGSWNRADRIGYNVSFVPFKDGKAQSGPEALLTGWMLGPDQRQVWGRPVAVLEMPDGSLLVSDDGGRKIWRIAYEG